MKLDLLTVSSEEQIISLSNGYYADLKFDLVYKRWYYDLYKNDELLYAGISLTPNSFGLVDIAKGSIGVVDRTPDGGEYEPYLELGNRLGVLEVYENEN